MVTKKKSNKRVSRKKSSKKKTSRKNVKKLTKSEFLKKRNKALYNFIMFTITFVLSLVLYLVTTNPVLELLFGIIAVLTGALGLTFLLILIGFLIYRKAYN